MIFILMDNGNGPPSLMQFLKSVDGKLKPSLEWPYQFLGWEVVYMVKVATLVRQKRIR